MKEAAFNKMESQPAVPVGCAKSRSRDGKPWKRDLRTCNLGKCGFGARHSDFQARKSSLELTFSVILRLRTNESLPRTRVLTNLDFFVSVKCVRKPILSVISRLRPFLNMTPNSKKHVHTNRPLKKKPAELGHPLQIGSLIPCIEGFID